MGNWQVGPPNSYIDIYPEWDTEQQKTLINVQHQRRRNGSLKTYVEAGDFDVINMPLSWIPNSLRTLVNSWMANGTDLMLIPDSDNIYQHPVPAIVDGDFEVGSIDGEWALVVTSGMGVASHDANTSNPFRGIYSGRIQITSMSGNQEDIKIQGRTDYDVTSGETYNLYVSARGFAVRNFDLRLRQRGAPYTNYGLFVDSIGILSTWATYVFSFQATATGSDAMLILRVGGAITNIHFDEIHFHQGSFYDVRITNIQEPFTSLVKPYNDLYEGEIVFETL